MDNLDQLKTIGPVAARTVSRFRGRFTKRIVEARYLLKGSIVLLSLAAAGLVPVSVRAASAVTTTFTVQATVNANCKVSAGPLLDLGTYAPGSGTNATGTNTISVNCTKGASFDVGLDGGLAANGGTASPAYSRYMSDGTDKLQYGLYTDAGHTTNWGNTVGTDTVSGTGTGMGAGQAQSYTVYGLVQDSGNNLNVGAGTYTDTITITVTY